MNDLERFIREDVGRGDLTTRALFGTRGPTLRARIFAREPVVAAGLTEAAKVLQRFGSLVTRRAKEGAWVKAEASLLELRGPVAGILTGERLALNFVGRMCGIATRTRKIVANVAAVNPHCRVAATRKTTPGFRMYEKRAVVLGGGDPHRDGLFDAVLIKDNHLEAFGADVARAVRRARRGARGTTVEVEVGTLRDALAGADAGADWILVDNASVQTARSIFEALRDRSPRVRVEVSGGIDERNAARYARWAHRLSVGALTHSARSADVTLELVAPKR